MANPEHLAKLKEGVEAWNQWREENPTVKPNLFRADLSGSHLGHANLSDAGLSDADLSHADLSDAKLSRVNLFGANLSDANFSRVHLSGAHLSHANLSRVNLSNATLFGANISGSHLDHANLSKADLSSSHLGYANLSEANLFGANLREANFFGANLSRADLSRANLFRADLSRTNLSGADLSRADLFGADLSRANLSGADLSKADLTAVQALETNFEQANLTGAVIEDWHIGQSTKLDSIKCDYIFRKNHPKTYEPTARLPSDPNSTFAPGEFVQRFQILESALETIDLTFTEGIDWKAFFTSFQKLRQQRPNDEISLQGIERKDETFIVRLEVPQEADKGAIETRVKQLYETERKVLEAQYEERLRLQGEHLEDAKQTIETERREKATLMGIMTTMANNQGPKNDFRGAKFAGGFAETVQGDQIGGTFNDYSINANPDEISALITRLADISQSFPVVQSQEVHIHLEDLANDLKQEKPQRSRLRTRLAALLGVAIAVGTTVATATDFANNVLELSQKLSIPPTEFQPQLQQLQQIQPDFF